MDISNFFNSPSKKKDLSDQSCNAEDAKKVTEGSSYISSVSLDDVFTEVMKSPECLHIIVDRMKYIEARINEICEMNQVTQDNQIKGKCQLRVLVKPIEFYNDKFHELERDNRKKEKKTNKLEEKSIKKMDKQKKMDKNDG